MFNMNPLNLPDAQLQHWIMLFVTGILGFIIGYISRQTTIRQLEGDLASTGRDLDDCQRVPIMSVSNEEEKVLSRIRGRAGEINFGRIGMATAAEADDLKEIVGIGPFLEKKLHTIGIYTFKQISRFEPDDVDKVNDIIEFFPGRIERDNWVSQATRLAK